MTQLVAPARLGVLLRPPVLRRPAYVVTLSAGAPLPDMEFTQVRWRQEGWTILGQRTIQTPEGPRQAYATVEMLRAGPLLIRGVLVLLLNVVLAVRVARLFLVARRGVAIDRATALPLYTYSMLYLALSLVMGIVVKFLRPRASSDSPCT